MTEDEAKTKWCPLAGKRSGSDSEQCIASNCMMWVADYVKSSTGKEGYCGIARSPERIR